jgi:hypothetical protein
VVATSLALVIPIGGMSLNGACDMPNGILPGRSEILWADFTKKVAVVGGPGKIGGRSRNLPVGLVVADFSGSAKRASQFFPCSKRDRNMVIN